MVKCRPHSIPSSLCSRVWNPDDHLVSLKKAARFSALSLPCFLTSVFFLFSDRPFLVFWIVNFWLECIFRFQKPTESNLIFRISIKQQEDPQRSTLNLLDGSMVETITSKILPTNSIVPSIGEGIIEWAVSSKNQKVRAHLYAALLNFINLQPDFYGESLNPTLNSYLIF